jgi:electron transfer flavoprotein alpha subunit
VGRGFKKKEDLQMAFELAKVLGGRWAVPARSRPT